MQTFKVIDERVYERITELTRKRRRLKVTVNLFYLAQLLVTIGVMITLLLVQTTQYIYSMITIILPIVIQAIHYFFPIESKITGFDIAIAQYKNIRYYISPDSVETTQMPLEVLYHEVRQRLSDLEKLLPDFTLIQIPPFKRGVHGVAERKYTFEIARLDRALQNDERSS